MECKVILLFIIGNNVTTVHPRLENLDRDGLDDDFEVHDSGTVTLLNGTQVNTGLDALNPDTDNDTISDGREMYGYNITYFKKVGDQNVSFNRTITGADPYTAYKYNDSCNKTWIDSDGDNIIDAIEQNPGMIFDSVFDNVDRIERVRRFYDYNMDREREDVINKQFNTYTVDTINPYSMELRVENILDGGDAKGRVHMEFFDASGIAYVNITNLDQGNYKNISASELEYYDGLIILDECIDIEGDSDYWVDGWDLGVLIVDENGNEFYEEKHVQSELGGIWQEFTEWIVEHVWGTVEEAVEKAKELGDASNLIYRSSTSILLSYDIPFTNSS